jgi:hypothetical protein
MVEATIELLQKWAAIAPEEARLKEITYEDGRHLVLILVLPALGQRFIPLLNELDETDLAYIDTLILGAVLRAFVNRQKDKGPFDDDINLSIRCGDCYASIDGAEGSLTEKCYSLPGKTALEAYLEYLEGLNA